MNWIPIPRYRVTHVWLIQLACGHNGVAPFDEGTFTWYRCPYCKGVARRSTEAVELPATVFP